MDDMMILDAVERYIRGEMNPDERLHFENLRKTNAEVDQLVVEHTLFMQQMNRFGEWQKFRTKLNEVHTDLSEKGKIDSAKLRGKAKMVYLWNRYKKVAAIAASIAGVTTMALGILVWSVTPKPPAASELQQLEGKLNIIEKKTYQQDKEINDVKDKINSAAETIIYTSGGTGFVIDAKGFLVTNAHVVKGAKYVAVQNESGEYQAQVVFTDLQKDIAVLKITDKKFKAFNSIPYSISKRSAGLAEPIFTLGYPTLDYPGSTIVYGEGYLSAKKGYQGDTLTCQVNIPANRGNSGSPVLNKQGEVVGIINSRLTNKEGFTFAVQAKYLYKILEELKQDSSVGKLKLPSRSTLSGQDRSRQVEKVEDYIFMVKVNN